jgi:enoyl-CoA hydratase/carnithine racemase
LSAEEALASGLATRLAADPRAAALEVAREIAARSPDAVRAAKRLLNLAMPDGAEAVLTAETEEQRRLLASANHAEAVRAGFEKRAPVFIDPPHISFTA